MVLESHKEHEKYVDNRNTHLVQKYKNLSPSFVHVSDDVCGNTNIVMKKMKHVCVMSYKLLEEGSADIDRIFNTAPLEKFCITSYDKMKDEFVTLKCFDDDVAFNAFQKNQAESVKKIVQEYAKDKVMMKLGNVLEFNTCDNF